MSDTKFFSPEGEQLTYHNSYYGKKLGVILAIEYNDLNKETIFYNDNYKDKKYREKYKDYIFKIPATFFDQETGKLIEGNYVYMTYKNADWIEYDTVKSYDGSCIFNTEYSMKIEVLLLDNSGYSRRLLFDYKGKGEYKFSFADFIENIDSIFDEIIKNPEKYGASILEDGDLIALDFYSDMGDKYSRKINSTEFKELLVSARVVEYNEKIIDMEEK